MKKQTFITHPTTKQLLLVLITWFSGTALLILSTTDFFTESFFQQKYLMIYFLLSFSTYPVVKVTVNYFRNQKIS